MEDQDRIETEEEDVEGHQLDPQWEPEREETDEPDVEGHQFQPQHDPMQHDP